MNIEYFKRIYELFFWISIIYPIQVFKFYILTSKLWKTFINLINLNRLLHIVVSV